MNKIITKINVRFVSEIIVSFRNPFALHVDDKFFNVLEIFNKVYFSNNKFYKIVHYIM